MSEAVKNTTTRGRDAETLVQNWLESQNYQFIERGFRWKCGEIDLIFEYGADLIFVEVRSAHRRSDFLRYSVTASKMKKIHRTAQVYLSKRKISRRGLRFDVVWAEGDSDGNWQFEHCKNVGFSSK